MKGMVDVCGGKMNIRQINEEIRFVMLAKKPKRLIVDIQRVWDGYHTTIYVDEESFGTENEN